jgi:hypothetical protein
MFCNSIDRHGPRLMPNTHQHFGPPYFSLPTTFNPSVIEFFNDKILLLLLLAPVLQGVVVLEKALL